MYIYERIMEGKGKVEDLKLLEDLALILEEASFVLWELTAQNIVLTTLKYFRDEYEAHIYDHSCPALICKPLINYEIDKDKCTGCMLCIKSCPIGAISGEAEETPCN